MSNVNKLWIFDIDGTLSDNEHRMHYIMEENRDWDTFFSLQDKDEPFGAVMEIFDTLSAAGHKCVIITARCERFRDVTLEWLNKHHEGTIKSKDVYMRPLNDRTDDDKIKIDILNKILYDNPQYRVMGIFEDRHRIIDAYRDAGFYVFECNQTRLPF
jgi:hypothetical protein